jgi:phosphoribosylformylglycinamidine cyclo-ligase
VVLNAYWSSSSYEWLTDKKLAEDFIKGWRAACDASGVVWGGGETQSLSGVVAPGALEFAGSAFGVIDKAEDLVQGKNLKDGDAIVLVESSGVHANGISLIRELADRLPEGYGTELGDGTTLGEAALAPTHLYGGLVKKLQAAGVDVHYLSNVTGHGWRKLMRAEAEFSYIINQIPPAHEIFAFIAEQTGNDKKEMYGNYNMGAGYAVYVPAGQAGKVVEAAAGQGLKAWVAGNVEKGPKKVVIKPEGITYEGDSLGVR